MLTRKQIMALVLLVAVAFTPIACQRVEVHHPDAAPKMGSIGQVTPVSSVFGRFGAVTAQSGDYTAAQVGAMNFLTTQSVVTAGTVTLVANSLTPISTASNAVTATLPYQPANATICVVKLIGQSSTNAITVNVGTGGSGSDVINKAGVTSQSVTLLYDSVWYQYQSSTGIWYAIDFPWSQVQAYLTANYFNVANGNTANNPAVLNSSGQLVGTILLRQDTAANLATTVPDPGQQAWATDTFKLVTGDGVNTFNNLAGIATSGTTGSTLAFSAASINAFPTASQSALGTGAVDLQGGRTQTYHTALSQYSYVAGYDNTAYSASPTVSTAIGSGNVAASTTSAAGCYAIGNSNVAAGNGAVVVSNGGTAVGTSSIAAGPSTVATGTGAVCLGASSKTGYDPLAFTASGTTATLTLTGAFKPQLAKTFSGGTAQLLRYNLAGGTGAIPAAGGTTNVTLNGTTTISWTDSGLGGATSGLVTPYSTSNVTAGGYQATAINGGRANGFGSTAIGNGALSYKPGQVALANVSLNGSSTFNWLNTAAATGSSATIVAGPGLSQHTTTVLVGQSTSSTPVTLTTDGLTPTYPSSTWEAASNAFNVQCGKTLGCTATITGRSTAGATMGHFVRRFVISNNAGTVALFGSVQTTPTGSDFTDTPTTGSALWTIAITADNTNKCIAVTCTGDTGGTNDTANVGWVCTIEANEIAL